MRNAPRHIDSERGASLIEFAAVFPVIFLLLAGLVDFGTALRRVEVISDAVRSAGRVAAQAPNRLRLDPTSAVCPDAGAITTRATNAATTYLGTDAANWDIQARVTYNKEGGVPLCALKLEISRDPAHPGCILCLSRTLGLPPEKAEATFTVEY